MLVLSTGTGFKALREEYTPKNKPVMVSRKSLGPLHDLLLRACPPNEKNEKSIYVLADRLGIRPWAVYKWISRNHIPARRAKEIVDIADGEVSISEFSPYIFL